ncbi:MAG: hypothetical protein Q8P18_19895 [Pseudomonadota bacterium]|nr:hypothetical protein [Pseudomonadota bacterium]
MTAGRVLVVCGAIALSVIGYAATSSVTEAAEGAPPAAAPAAPISPAVTAAPSVAPQEGVRTLAAALERRVRGLDEREASLLAREQGLRDAQAKLDARLTELTAIRTAISADLDRADVRRETRVGALVTMVESNRASSIAPMFGALEVPLAVDVLDRMNRQKAGKLLAALPPARAAVFATRMASPIVVAP